MQPYQNALDLAVPTIKSVNDPILSSLYNKGEKFSFPEYGALAKKYNERSQVIKAFAIKILVNKKGYTMDSFTLTLYVSSLLLLQSLSFLFKDEVEEFDTSLICLSLMCAVGIKLHLFFLQPHFQ
ncbi:hypothetical protein [Acinetobacter baumannii]|uniref:hypothetical protein n=1 Tax=Acinetobacter baumannii TaxID=470 RepID=UPI001E4112BF|nr:hypothetical protein [Acinetobacter baumannii]